MGEGGEKSRNDLRDGVRCAWAKPSEDAMTTKSALRQLTKFTSAESWRVLDMDFLEDGILYVALAVFYVDSPLDCDCYFFCGLSLF